MKIYDDQLIVVTGGAGFIGSNVVKTLNDQGMKNLVIVDDFGDSTKWKNLVGKKFLEVVDKNQLFSWLPGRESSIEAVIHLGACTDTTETDASYLLENNYRYSIRLAEYALKNQQRFIYASSAATYGDGSHGFSDDHKTLDQYLPLNMYGYSKHLFDLWLQNQNVLEKVVGLKFFNVFGPNEYHKGKMISPIPPMVKNILEGHPVRLFKSNDAEYPDGDQKRDFIYVKDVARMVTAFLENDATGIYNVGTGKATTWNDIAKATFKALQKPAKIEYIDMPAALNKQYQNYTCAEVKKLKHALKEGATTTAIEKAVVDYVREYLLPQKHL